jgi:hypothetical protein
MSTIQSREDEKKIIQIIRDNTEFKNEKLVKDSILELAKFYAEGITEQRLDRINKMKLILKKDAVTLENISSFIHKYLESELIHVAYPYISRILPAECKREYTQKEQVEEEKGRITVEDLDDNLLAENQDQILQRIRELNPQPKKDHVGKSAIEDPAKFCETKWSHYAIEEMAKIVSQLNDSVINGEYCTECRAEESIIKNPLAHKDCKKATLEDIQKELISIRDNRHMTSEQKMKAVIIASETFSSLKYAIKGTNYIVSRWDVYDNEKDCKECRGLVQCRKESCNHHCHLFQKEGTTKGAKFAINTDESLKDLKSKLIEMNNYQPKDLCVLLKQIFENENVKLDSSKAIKLFDSHINLTNCEVCQTFLNAHPDFFKGLPKGE